jgi:UDP-N-acetylglucosamine diphosphorylase / glucose-1-phosphate thymidylyltransferase / UDP-N-acetylgalactosamine diphosphorylase / glucosamine-1-phosphate N-acetyltransferase / galactosamine-1-phosphate N-acetyltransferase
MIKKVVIAAAGKGTRMLELAKDKPKHIIQVAGKPFLYYLLQNLKAAGLEDIILVVGHHKQKMIDFVDLVKEEFSITLVDQFEQLGQAKYGTACPIEAAAETIGHEQFVAVYGDNLYSVDDLKAININDEYNYVAGFEHTEPERYGVLVTHDGLLEQIIEKPAREIAEGHTINTGLYKFTSEIFKAINKTGVSPSGEYYLTDAISLLAHEAKVKVIKIKDYWLDFGRPEDVETVSDFLNNKS